MEFIPFSGNHLIYDAKIARQYLPPKNRSAQSGKFLMKLPVRMIVKKRLQPLNLTLMHC